ncbi:uncharacterized protein DS421_8g228120 [Arachis hypogaea]|nr:uncharacterized protein DS421_8g228120 [Arachis hypogaea]
MKSDDQGRTRGNCMLGFAWVISSLSLAEPVLFLEKKKLAWFLASKVEASLFYKKREQPRVEARSKEEE